MKVNYYPDTDSVYIDLADKAVSDSKEVADGVVLDFDENGNVIGIDLQDASKKLDLKTLESVSISISIPKSA